MFKEIAVFLVARCSANCRYCLQQGFKRGAYKEVSPDKWVNYLSNCEFAGSSLSLIGGEPTLYGGFKELIEALHDKFLITVTTNMKSPLFEDIAEFINWAANYRVRWNFSFHPEALDIGDFVNKIATMRNAGLFVDQVASVHVDEIEPYTNILCNSAIGFWLQCPTWIENGILHPTKEELDKFGSGEAGINDYEDYEWLCGGNENKTVICYTGKFLIDPEGDVFRCHSDLYHRRSSLGNVFEGVIKPNFVCDKCGQCNPCDYTNIRYVELGK